MKELSEREQYIVRLLTENGSVSVADLSRQFSVSEVTIRSDLSDLELHGLLSRTHGGAISSVHPHILERQNMAIEEKNRIAKAAAARIHDNDTVMIEAGTTVSCIPKYLFGKRDIHIITNSALAFRSARNNPALKITVAGGDYCNATDSFTGYIAEETIRHFNVKYAFVGTDGFSVKAGITTHLFEAAQMIKVMREKASQLILVSDSSKYNKTGVVSILPLSDIDLLITDTDLDAAAVIDIRQNGCPVELY